MMRYDPSPSHTPHIIIPLKSKSKLNDKLVVLHEVERQQKKCLFNELKDESSVTYRLHTR